ncbi:hypothetical protein HY480_00085 [Candidatus Uhrbacteria bacterium]|nr:hypothetical protein [Candidatus Uhrbacteria bacterium]
MVTKTAAWCAVVLGFMALTAMLAQGYGMSAIDAQALVTIEVGVAFVLVVVCKRWWQHHDAMFLQDQALATFAFGTAFIGGCAGIAVHGQVHDVWGAHVQAVYGALLAGAVLAGFLADSAFDAYSAALGYGWWRRVITKSPNFVLMVYGASGLAIGRVPLITLLPLAVLSILALFSRRAWGTTLAPQ